LAYSAFAPTLVRASTQSSERRPLIKLVMEVFVSGVVADHRLTTPAPFVTIVADSIFSCCRRQMLEPKPARPPLKGVCPISSFGRRPPSKSQESTLEFAVRCQVRSSAPSWRRQQHRLGTQLTRGTKPSARLPSLNDHVARTKRRESCVVATALRVFPIW
jgi:hypothetical protein